MGRISVQITGVNTGDAVMVRNFLDVNGNGIIDEGDMLMEAYRVVDGQQSLIGGATNINVPGDMNSTNGVISTFLPYAMNRPQMGIGQHLIKVSSPSTNFTAITNSFVITNWPYPQSISGTVTCATTNVPNASVVFLDFSDPNGKNDIIAEVLADATGAYNVKLPAGTYMVLSFKAGYVYSMGELPPVTLTNGANVTANLTLMPATQTLGGTLTDTANTNQGIEGVFLICQSAGGLITIGTTDKTGKFALPTVPDVWSTKLDNSMLYPIGYITPQKESPPYDTTSGSITNVALQAVRGTAMVYGTIRDLSNNPISGINFYGNDDAHSLETIGKSDVNGNYSIAATAANWWMVGPDTSEIGTNAIVGGVNQITLTNGQAARQDVVIAQATAYIHGTVRNAQGQPVAGVSMWAGTSANGVNFNSNSQTDTNGNYTLAAFNGLWSIGMSCEGNVSLSDLGYQCPNGNVMANIPSGALQNFTLYPLGTSRLDPPFITHFGQVAITIYGETGTNYIVQYSTNVANPASWQTVGSIKLTNQVGLVWDNSATNKSRFYRARIWP
jgi:hypothetical protein